jgi:hypothetical protein
MEAIKDFVRKPIGAGIVGFVLGLVLGWFVIGYWLYPVEWTDAAPGDLRQDQRVDFLRMAISDYNLTFDANQAQNRWVELGTAAPETLDVIVANPGALTPAAVESFRQVVSGVEVADAGAGGSNNMLVFLCLLALLAGLAFGGLYIYRRSGRVTTEEESASMQAVEVSKQAERTDYTGSEDPPLAQFMTTYLMGDDLFDDSFSVDSPSGEFLGECGVGIAETIGVGEPKRVTGYEVWLFDKNDIQTVTKVLMSMNAFNDTDLRERLAAKGEPVLAEPGNQVVLETATLQLVARIVDMSYGEGALPDNSFFDRMTLELAVWSKES